MGLLEQQAIAPLIWAVAMGYGITVGDRLLSLPDKQPPAKLRHMEGAWNTHSPGGRGSERAGELLLLLLLLLLSQRPARAGGSACGICSCGGKCPACGVENRGAGGRKKMNQGLEEIVVSNKQSHGLLQLQNISYFQIHRPQCLQDSAVFVQRDEVYCLKAKLDSGVPFKKYKNFSCLPRTFTQYFLP